jgi:glycosyltransferase involved in cell wall biosynthesis
VVLGGSAVGELVAPSQSGEIVTSLKQMVEVLVHLSHHPEDIQDMGDAARELAEQHFGFARVAKKFASLYDV